MVLGNLLQKFFIDCHSERSEESDLLPQILRYAQNDKMQLKSFRTIYITQLIKEITENNETL